MIPFRCGRCGHAVFFENVRCGRCNALLGYLPGWEAKLNEPVDQPTLALWEILSNRKLTAEPGKTLRKEVLHTLFKNL